jgi:hypothetical protein
VIVDELHKHGIEIVFLNRAIGASPEEDLLLQMQGIFASKGCPDLHSSAAFGCDIDRTPP